MTCDEQVAWLEDKLLEVNAAPPRAKVKPGGKGGKSGKGGKGGKGLVLSWSDGEEGVVEASGGEDSESDGELCEFDAVVNKRIRDGVEQYKTVWKGDGEPSWLGREQFTDASVLDEFEAKLRVHCGTLIKLPKGREPHCANFLKGMCEYHSRWYPAPT